MTVDAAADVRRMLVAARGPLAMRLIRAYRARGIETVAAFTEREAEAAYVEAADYDAFLGEGHPDEVWADPVRAVAAAMDAGCDGIHPGRGPLARDLELYAGATAANLLVVGLDPRRAADVLDAVRFGARLRASSLKVPPWEVVGAGDDGIDAAARVGVPLVASPVHGGLGVRVDGFDALAPALAAVRARGGDGRVVLGHAVGEAQVLDAVIVGDKAGVTGLGVIATADGVATYRATGWQAQLDAAAQLAREVGFVGVGSARFAVGPRGTPWFVGLRAHLPAAYALVELVEGVDLVDAELTTASRQPLGWDAPTEPPSRVGCGARIAATGAGTVVAVDVPPNAPERVCEVGCAVGEAVSPDDEAGLVSVACVGADPASARGALVGALAAVRVEGAPTTLAAVLVAARSAG